MSDKEAKKLANMIRRGTIESAMIVIKFLGIGYKRKNGRTKRPSYQWLNPKQ